MQFPSMPRQLEDFARSHGLPSPKTVEDDAGCHAFVYSSDQTRRYAYSLTWSNTPAHLLWVMLNPGTGETEGRRRNTFERCRKWSQKLGYGGLIFGNVFSERTKAAKDLQRLELQNDILNHEALYFLSKHAASTVVAWGNNGSRSNRAKSVGSLLSNPQCFGLTKAGEPRHPLYVPAATKLLPWQPALGDA